MVEVIKKGELNRAECKFCGSILSYGREDRKEKEVHISQFATDIMRYIICPVCGNKVSV